MSHGISDLAAVGDHFVEVNEKVDIVGILEANTGFSQPVKQFPVEFQCFNMVMFRNFCNFAVSHL